MANMYASREDAPGMTAVQIVWFTRRGSRSTEHHGSAQPKAELVGGICSHISTVRVVETLPLISGEVGLQFPRRSVRTGYSSVLTAVDRIQR